MYCNDDSYVMLFIFSHIPTVQRNFSDRNNRIWDCCENIRFGVPWARKSIVYMSVLIFMKSATIISKLGQYLGRTRRISENVWILTPFLGNNYLFSFKLALTIFMNCLSEIPLRVSPQYDLNRISRKILDRLLFIWTCLNCCFITLSHTLLVVVPEDVDGLQLAKRHVSDRVVNRSTNYF